MDEVAIHVAKIESLTLDLVLLCRTTKVTGPKLAGDKKVRPLRVGQGETTRKSCLSLISCSLSGQALEATVSISWTRSSSSPAESRGGQSSWLEVRFF